jgi:SAM-dependent methyltransferase
MAAHQPEFKDHFSGHADEYGRFRPTYPDELFTRLADRAPARDLAWDCATGNGQAAAGLARHFARVLATDASAAQIERATPIDGVEFVVATAEASGLAPNSVDLICVAQALHWFNADRFYAEVRRVAKPGAFLAAFGYGLFTADEAVDTIVARLYRDIVGPYWPPERNHVDHCLRDIAFPFAEVSPEAVHMEADWDLRRVLGYLRTWSACKRYQQVEGIDPVTLVETDLRAAWASEKTTSKRLRWPLFFRAGHVP